MKVDKAGQSSEGPHWSILQLEYVDIHLKTANKRVWAYCDCKAKKAILDTPANKILLLKVALKRLEELPRHFKCTFQLSILLYLLQTPGS